MHLLVVALRLAKIDPYEGFASNPRHITAESAVTRITLRYVSPCIRLELRRVPAKLLLPRSNGWFTSIRDIESVATTFRFWSKPGLLIGF
jgi:hypothetical protein